MADHPTELRRKAIESLRKRVRTTGGRKKLEAEYAKVLKRNVK